MHFDYEQARKQSLLPLTAAKGCFPDWECQDAAFLTARRDKVLAVAGFPYPAPVCAHMLGNAEIASFVTMAKDSVLFLFVNLSSSASVKAFTTQGEAEMPEEIGAQILDIARKILASPGILNSRGELEIDLKAYPVGPHFSVNLLLGNRMAYNMPLVTTPKGAVDALGRGSLRGCGGQQILATRYVLDATANGEPANRQFYLVENGKQVFYSANVNENVKSARCIHGVNETRIEYELENGLSVKRTFLMLPQHPGMPNAVEAQRIEIVNHRDTKRELSLVCTGVFGIANPDTIANDVVYANLVMETEVCYENGNPIAMMLHPKPAEEQDKKRFALILSDGSGMDAFCSSQTEFIGTGTLEHPELVGHLSNAYQMKMAPFFAMEKKLTLEAGGSCIADFFAGMINDDGIIGGPVDEMLANFVERYRRKESLEEDLEENRAFAEKYHAFLKPETPDERFNAYAYYNLPFQVLYQTYVSRAFAWTQKSYREIGFREIQDIFASMNYLVACGEGKLVRELLGNWISNVYRMGYANHNFTFTGKEPGDCSDDQLWLMQAVYRYVRLTGDTDILLSEFPIAGEKEKRPLMETLMAILIYSGSISVGAHGLPLLDKADWNDTLRLDHGIMQGPEKERHYMAQLKEKGQQYGVPLENRLSESVMNACLLKVAADETAELARMIRKTEEAQKAESISSRIADAVQKYAWKDDFFARCLINDDREGGYTYLGATGDRLSLDPAVPGSYFLNSFSWSILAGIANEDQVGKMLRIVNKYLRTEAGLKLCTLVNYDLLGISTGTALYFAGDRENCGVFKHAAMMATVACLKACKWVEDETLAADLRELAFFMLDRTFPYKTMENPFILKGNPRFCTQYNNSETGENIGPMLSGTASWLTLAMMEFLGVDETEHTLKVCPVLRTGEEQTAYTMKLGNMTLQIRITAEHGRFRVGENTTWKLDGMPVSSEIAKPLEGIHELEICL